MRRIISLIVLLALPLSASAGIVWKSDFESGDISEWDRTQIVSSDRMQVVSSPVRSGNKALMVTVKQGDDPINSSGNRNELVQMTNEAEGSEYYYGWSTMFRDDFPAPATWQIFAQWHHSGCCGSPPIEYIINDDRMMFRANGIYLWEAPLVRGVWNDFIMRVKWSPNSNVGFVEVWHNNELVVPKTSVATQYPGDSQYLKLGLYRSDTISPTGVLFHDNFRMATSREDLMPTPIAEEPPVAEEPPATEEPPAMEEPVTSLPGFERPTLPLPEFPTQLPRSPGEPGGPVLTGPGEPLPVGCSATGEGSLLSLMLLALLGVAIQSRRKLALQQRRK